MNAARVPTVSGTEAFPLSHIELRIEDLEAFAHRLRLLSEEWNATVEAEYDAKTRTEADWLRTVVDAQQRRVEAITASWQGSGMGGRQTAAAVEEELQTALDSLERAQLQLADYLEARRQGRADSVRAASPNPPRCVISNRFGQVFDSEDWATVWARVGPDNVDEITLSGVGVETSVTINLVLRGRRTTADKNVITIRSTSQTALNEQRGYFGDVLKTRHTRARRWLTAVPVGFLIWTFVPALAIAAAVTTSLHRLGLVSLEAGYRVAVAVALSIALVVPVNLVAGYLLDRLAPSVTVRGAGPYLGVRSRIGEIASSVVATLILGGILFVPGLLE